MITYKGLPSPVISDFMSREASRSHYAEGTEFNIAKIEMVANTGTYIDSPFHRYARGKDLAHLELESSRTSRHRFALFRSRHRRANDERS
jgi:kynurenine formamidase